MLLFLTACAGGGSNGGGGGGFGSDEVPATGGTVATADGKATLTIPSGALASPTTITIERIDGQPPHADLGDAVAAGDGVYYKLGPDGLTFANPVSFSVALDGVAARKTGGSLEVPAVAAFSVAEDGTTEALDDLELTVDPDTGAVSVGGTLSHFSAMEFRPIGDHLVMRVEGVPDTPIAPDDTFAVTAVIGVDGLFNPRDEYTLRYLDFSVFPIQYNSADPIPADQAVWTDLPYICNAPGGSGVYQAYMELALKEGVEFWVVGKSPTSAGRIPAAIITPRYLFTKPVSCPPPTPKVSFRLGEDTSTAENGKFAFAADLTAPLDVDLTIPVTFSGTATEGDDWVWNGERDGAGSPFMTIGAGSITVEAEYRILDDTDVEGDETIEFGIDPPSILPLGRIEVVPPLSYGFTLTDDPTEPTLRGGDGDAFMLFFAEPALVTKFVGQSAVVEVAELLFNVPAEAQDVQVLIAIDNPAVLGVPVLLPPGPFDGTTNVTFEPAAGLFVSRLTVRTLFPTDDNVQTLSYPCAAAGEASLLVSFFDLTHFPDAPTELARTTVDITCEPQEIVGWTDSLELGYAPEGFLGGIGPHVRSNNGPEGDPFADPETVRHQALDVLGLPTDRDFALVAGADRIGVWDLLDGTEVTRLAMPFGPYQGGTFLVAPDSAQPPEWLVFYNISGGFSESRYNPDTGEWGAVQIHPTGGSVFDIVPGPLDADGRDTGYLVTNYGNNTVQVRIWDAGLTDWVPDPSQLRARGAWDDEGGTAASAVGGFDGPALVLVHNGADLPGSLWLFDPTEPASDNHDQKIGTVGLLPNQLRCLRGVCVATSFDSPGSITTVSWTAPGATPVVRDTRLVGADPLEVDLIPDPAGGGVLALTAGYNDGSFTVTEIAADATVTASTTTALTDCANPGNARFTDGTGSHVMVSCSGSDRVVIVPR